MLLAFYYSPSSEDKLGEWGSECRAVTTKDLWVVSPTSDFADLGVNRASKVTMLLLLTRTSAITSITKVLVAIWISVALKALRVSSTFLIDVKALCVALLKTPTAAGKLQLVLKVYVELTLAFSATYMIRATILLTD